MPAPQGDVSGDSPLYLIPILSIAIQAGLIVHVIKTGRNMLWIWAIALLPLVGSIAYAAVEVLPQVLGGRTARRAKTGVRRMIDPDRELRRATAEVEISGNVDARRRLAEELFERGRYDAAIDVYQGGLKGIFEHDPTLLLGAARAHFAKQDYAAGRAMLERLRHCNPDFKSADADLLYARTLEAQEALDEWVTYYNSQRPHQALGDVAPAIRFTASERPSADPRSPRPERSGEQWVCRRVASNGVVSVDYQQVSVGRNYAGSSCDVLVTDGLLQFWVGSELLKTVARTGTGVVRKLHANGTAPRPR